MKKMFSFLYVSALAAILMLAACSSNNDLSSAGDEAIGDEKLNLEEEFGGFDTSDEATAFGEADMLDAFPQDEDAGDPIADESDVAAVLDGRALNDSTPVKAYFLRITYGLLEGDSTATEVIDWSGSAEVNKGTLVVLKTIRFESNDAIQLPRESRQVVEFTSQTQPHLDGMLLAIIDYDTTDVEGAFTFNAGTYSKVLAFSELDSLELLEPVGGAGHEVSIITRSHEYLPFSGGFISGRWTKAGRNNGQFRGRWINSLGANAGHVRGIWGINRAGNKVFKGKYISLNGEFRGLLAGEWSFERGENGGFFRGRWVNRELDNVGTLRGKFKTGRVGDGRGFFHGRYRARNSDNAEVN